MPEEHHLTARNLLEQMNRQFNECNALYHAYPAKNIVPDAKQRYENMLRHLRA